MAVKAYVKTARTGGGAGSLDAVDGAGLNDGDIAFVTVSGVLYVYILDDNLAGAESDPSVITPDTNAGDKRWVAQTTYPLDGLTATVAELNILDGVTATYGELNLMDGSVAGTAVANRTLALGANKNVDTIAIAQNGLCIGSGAGTAVTATAAELNILDGVWAAAAELNALAGVTPGTATASRALVLGADKNVDTLAIAQNGLCIGSGAGTAVTATAAELNILDGVTATATELNYVDGVTSNIQTQLNAKASASSPTFSGMVQFGSQTITASGTTAITANTVILNRSASGGIAATYTISAAGVTMFIYCQAVNTTHTVTLGGGGTFDGTNNRATFNAVGDYLYVSSVSTTRFVILTNNSVTLSSV